MRHHVERTPVKFVVKLEKWPETVLVRVILHLSLIIKLL